MQTQVHQDPVTSPSISLWGPQHPPQALIEKYGSQIKASLWVDPNGMKTFLESRYDCCSDAKSCPTLCSPVDCRTPASSVLHHLPELLKFKSIESVTPSNHLILSALFSRIHSFPHSGSFPVSQLLASSGQSIGASASVLPMNTRYDGILYFLLAHLAYLWDFRKKAQGTGASLCLHGWKMLPQPRLPSTAAGRLHPTTRAGFYTMEYYSAINRNEFESVLMSWMNLEPIIQREVSQKEKKIYILTHTHTHTYIWNLEKWYWWTFFHQVKERVGRTEKVSLTYTHYRV